MVCGRWTLTPFWPKSGHLSIWNYTFSKPTWQPDSFEPQFRWNWTNLKIWPLYKRSMTFCCFGLYLENETSYGFHVIYFFAPYDLRKNLICITTKLNHFHYSTDLEDGWTLTPCNDPLCSWFWMVSTLGMLLIVYRIHLYRTRFYIMIMQLALKYGVLPPR